MKLRHQIPDVYQKFFFRALLDVDPAEAKATCSACAMAPGKHRGKHTYRPDLKCCTFHPWIPNYAVGAVLRETGETSAKGREVLRDKIRRREYALPTGVLPPVNYQVEFNARAPTDFGNRDEWLCPYYDRGTELCGLWKNRGAVCTSYHCKSVHGKTGKVFWKNLENYLSYVEMALMEEALVQLDFSPRQLSDLLGYMNRFDGTVAEKKSSVLPEKKARELWNGYYDEQELFYEKCLRVVEKMDRAGFEEALGETGLALEEDVLVGLGLWQPA